MPKSTTADSPENTGPSTPETPQTSAQTPATDKGWLAETESFIQQAEAKGLHELPKPTPRAK